MGALDDLKEVKKSLNEIKQESFALEILKDYKKQNKRLFIVLLVVLCMWFASMGAFIYYINTTGYEEITEEATTDNGGNACVGDNCNNGEISYGNSKTNN